MELQILKIEKDKINFLEEVRKIIEANPYNDIKGIYLDYIMDDKIKLSIEYNDKDSIIVNS